MKTSQVKRLRLTAMKRVNTLFAGLYHSVFKGRGSEFEEVREYVPGDDIRSLDWNLLAKTQKPFVKLFREERDLSIFLMVDISASMRFGDKTEKTAEIGTLIALAAIKNNDRVGLILFTDKVELYVPPKKGTKHIHRLIRELLYFTPASITTALPPPLDFLRRVQKKRAVCFILSDFQAPLPAKELALLAKKHRLFALKITDERERGDLFKGLIRLRDLETREERWVDMTEKLFSKKEEEEAKKTFKQANIASASFSSGESATRALYRLLKT